MSIRSRISGKFRDILRKRGQELVRSHEAYIPGLHRRRLMTLLNINLVLDVGANIGQTGIGLRQAGYTGRIVSFEPLSVPFNELSKRAGEDARWQVRHCALGDASGEAKMNVSGTDWSSSLLPMTGRHTSMVPESAYVGTETVQISRLDDVFDEYAAAGDRIFLKADTQGYELPVLRGAPVNLAKIDLIQLELSFVPLYAGQPTYYEVMKFMDEIGYDMVGIGPDFYEKETARYLQADGYFVRRGEAAHAKGVSA